MVVHVHHSALTECLFLLLITRFSVSTIVVKPPKGGVSTCECECACECECECVCECKCECACECEFGCKCKCDYDCECEYVQAWVPSCLQSLSSNR